MATGTGGTTYSKGPARFGRQSPFRWRSALSVGTGTMTDNDIRAQFRKFAGEDRFRDFTMIMVNSLGTTHFAPHYRDQWEAFCSQCADAPHEFERIRQLLLYCHLHDVPLERDQLKHPSVDRETLRRITHKKRSSEWYAAAAIAFPHGHGGLDVICLACVAAHLKWLDENPKWLSTRKDR
jgi:hypothetical protein